MSLISVIIPVYKVEKYLPGCVDSVLAQTHRELEVILVDDGSPDNCGAICDEYAAKDPRIKVIHQPNLNVSAARNAGLELATGEYFAFVDSDDSIEPAMYERMLAVMEEYQADIVECGHRWIRPNRLIDGVLDKENTGKVEVFTNVEALEKLYFGEQMFGGLSIMVWGKLYRASAFAGLRFSQERMYEDALFMPMAFYRAGKVVKLNQNLYNFFMAEGSLTRSGFSLRNLDAISVRKKCMEFFKEKGLERYYHVSQRSLFDALFGNYYDCRLRKKDPACAKAAKDLKKQLRSQLPQMKSNPFYRGNKKQILLFTLSPTLWFAAAWIKKKIQHLKWLRKHKKRLRMEEKMRAGQAAKK